MNASLIFFSINAMMRLAQNGRISLEDYAADKAAVFPTVKFLPLTQKDQQDETFSSPKFQKIIKQPQFLKIREDLLTKKTPGGFWPKENLSLSEKEQISVLLIKIKTEFLKEKTSGFLVSQKFRSAIKNRSNDEIIGAYLVKQWGDKSIKRGPMARILFTIGAIASEYVQMDPSLFGNSGKGKIFLQGFSGALATQLNQYIAGSDFTPQARFTEYAATLILHSGLSVLQKNPELIVSKEHIAVLIGNTLDPVIKAFRIDSDLNTRLEFKSIAEAFIGPAMNAALATVAENPSRYLGNGFDQSKAAGVLSGALLTRISEEGVQKSMTAEGLFALYKASLQAVSTNPELFINFGSDQNAGSQAAEDIFKKVIAALENVPGPFNTYFQDIPPMIMAAALEAAGQNIHRFASTDEWEQLAADLASHVLKGFAAEFQVQNGGGNPFGKVISKTLIIELGRIVLQQSAKTPGMLGINQIEVQQIIRAIAQAMAADKNLLLSPGDWRAIAQIASAEAAANPGRLFGFDENNSGENLAGGLMKIILLNASKGFGDSGHKGRAVLFGATLQQVISFTIQKYAGAPNLAIKHQAQISAIIIKLNGFINENHGLYGSKEWLRLYRVMLAQLLQNNEVAKLATTFEADRLLRGGIA